MSKFKGLDATSIERIVHATLDAAVLNAVFPNKGDVWEYAVYVRDTSPGWKPRNVAHKAIAGVRWAVKELAEKADAQLGDVSP